MSGLLAMLLLMGGDVRATSGACGLTVNVAPEAHPWTGCESKLSSL